MKKISISQIKEVAQQAYEQVKGNTDGKNADYIPYLANIDKNLFGISICLLNGQKITIGDYNYRFGIESVSKVHTAILVLRQYGAQKILDMIGADATLQLYHRYPSGKRSSLYTVGQCGSDFRLLYGATGR